MSIDIDTTLKDRLMDTSLEQRRQLAPHTSPGVEIHLVDHQGIPQGGVFTRYRLDINDLAAGFELVVELFDLAGGSALIVLARDLTLDGAEALRRTVHAAIITRRTFSAETFKGSA